MPVSPYLLFRTVVAEEQFDGAYQLFSALTKGLEKVISTNGIHELRGYNRIFSAIGLRSEVAEVLNIVNFLGSETIGLGFKQLEEDSRNRAADFNAESSRASKTFRLFPRLWKSIGQVASGSIEYQEYAEKLEEQEKENPIAIRHVTDLKVINEEKRSLQC